MGPPLSTIPMRAACHKRKALSRARKPPKIQAENRRNSLASIRNRQARLHTRCCAVSAQRDGHWVRMDPSTPKRTTACAKMIHVPKWNTTIASKLIARMLRSEAAASHPLHNSFTSLPALTQLLTNLPLKRTPSWIRLLKHPARGTAPEIPADRAPGFPILPP